MFFFFPLEGNDLILDLIEWGTGVDQNLRVSPWEMVPVFSMITEGAVHLGQTPPMGEYQAGWFTEASPSADPCWSASASGPPLPPLHSSYIALQGTASCQN